SCQLDDTVDGNGRPLASCAAQNAGRPASASCAADADCRNGTCALGRCVDLCDQTRDCGAGTSCMGIPRVHSPPQPADGAMFDGCLPSNGSVTWTIPVLGPATEILLPVPGGARSATVVFRVDDVAQTVGASQVIAPTDSVLAPSYIKPCTPGPACDESVARSQYFSQRLRHLPEPGQSVLQIPASSTTPLEPGAYRIRVSSFRSNGSAGSAIPHVTAIMKMDTAVILDLHFYFLDLDDHPCKAAFADQRIEANTAQTASYFQNEYLGELLAIFAGGGLSLGATTYEDVPNHPDLDGLAVADAGSLLSLGARGTGINVFFVRTLSPVGLQAFGPNPGPAGLGGTRQSGVIIGVDTLCYRSWTQLARLTAHEVARYMGLYHNVELEVGQHPTWRDPIDDSDDSRNNLMFFSELGGFDLSAGQRSILTKSAVLR
ncbi:MAG: hypothetical protein H0T42_19350, partial [Deltaproteobacteria bacterium]|nr:hypothetical protein [Deltaproteobacteria bacterium]